MKPQTKPEAPPPSPAQATSTTIAVAAPAPEAAPKKKRVAPASPQRSPIVWALVAANQSMTKSTLGYSEYNAELREKHRREKERLDLLKDENTRAALLRERLGTKDGR